MRLADLAFRRARPTPASGDRLLMAAIASRQSAPGVSTSRARIPLADDAGATAALAIAVTRVAPDTDRDVLLSAIHQHGARARPASPPAVTLPPAVVDLARRA
jgi:hypothetical protein